jgi:pimeloyl-ACP methyl ester carboxylesterase
VDLKPIPDEPRRLLLLALAFVLLLLAPFSLAAEPRLDLQRCRIGMEWVRCGRLNVPENWNRPTGRRIDLKIIVLPKIGPGPEQAPMIWLEGGPGVPGTISAPLYTSDLKLHRNRRAVVLFDQRGTGESNALRCPKIENQSPLADEWSAVDVVDCRRALEARADLAQYSTEASARDLETLRQALGADKLDLAGLSYGTWLAQAYMKLYPERVRSAALIGTVPIGEKLPLHHTVNGQEALRLLFADCRADRPCHAAFPDLSMDWERLQGGLAEHPMVVNTPVGSLLVRQGPFNELVRGQLNAVESARRLPVLINHAARGDYAPLIKLVQAQGPEPEAEGLYLSITCPEATLRIRADEIGPATRSSSFGRYRIDQQVAACRLWARSTPSARLLTPLVSDTPVLLLAGGRDATTPASWAWQVSAGLPNSRVVIIEPMSHLPVGLDHMDCLDRIMDAFFAKRSADGLDTSCVATMAPPAFHTQ